MSNNNKKVKKIANNNKKVSVLLNLPVELNNKYKELADSLGVPKTYLFITALHDYFKNEKKFEVMSEMVNIMKSEEDGFDLEDIENYMSALQQLKNNKKSNK